MNQFYIYCIFVLTTYLPYDMRILIISKIYDPAKIICFMDSTIILIDDYIYAYNKNLEFIDKTKTNPLKRFF